jgi:hypothetical protein
MIASSCSWCESRLAGLFMRHQTTWVERGVKCGLGGFFLYYNRGLCSTYTQLRGQNLFLILQPTIHSAVHILASGFLSSKVPRIYTAGLNQKELLSAIHVSYTLVIETRSSGAVFRVNRLIAAVSKWGLRTRVWRSCAFLLSFPPSVQYRQLMLRGLVVGGDHFYATYPVLFALLVRTRSRTVSS